MPNPPRRSFPFLPGTRTRDRAIRAIALAAEDQSQRMLDRNNGGDVGLNTSRSTTYLRKSVKDYLLRTRNDRRYLARDRAALYLIPSVSEQDAR